MIGETMIQDINMVYIQHTRIRQLDTRDRTGTNKQES